jgi:hypothetical protein
MWAMIATTVKAMKLVTKIEWNSRASGSVIPEMETSRPVTSAMLPSSLVAQGPLPLNPCGRIVEAVETVATVYAPGHPDEFV